MHDYGRCALVAKNPPSTGSITPLSIALDKNKSPREMIDPIALAFPSGIYVRKQQDHAQRANQEHTMWSSAYCAFTQQEEYGIGNILWLCKLSERNGGDHWLTLGRVFPSFLQSQAHGVFSRARTYRCGNDSHSICEPFPARLGLQLG